MTVTKEIARLEKSSVRLTVTVGKDDARSEYDALLSEYAKSLQLPGFRKGKVPKDVLVRKFGDALKMDATGKIIEKAMGDILDNESLPRGERPLPYSTPSLEEEPKLDLEKDLVFSLVYDVFPAVKVEKWEGIKIEIPDVSISDEDLARELESIRDRNSIVLDKDEDAAAEIGDVVTVDYSVTDEGVEEITAEDKRDDFTFTLGSALNAYQFDDEIVGMKKGETKEFTKAYQEGAELGLSGKTKKFVLTLKSLKEKRLPDLDDDLAQDVDEKFETLNDLKKNVRERLEGDLEKRLRTIKLNKILETIMENTPVEIPESMIRLELDSRWRNLARQFNTDSDGLYKIMGNINEKVGSIIESWKPDAVRALHSRLIVETLIEDLKLEATDDDIDKEIGKLAMESGSEEQDVRDYYEKDEAMEYLKEDIKESKFFDILLEKSAIKIGEKINYLDLAGSHNHHNYNNEQETEYERDDE